MPLSTKLLSAFAVLLVVGGALLAVWQHVGSSAEGTVVPGVDAEGGTMLPGIGAVLPLAGAFVVFVCLAGVVVLFRGKGRRH